MTQVKPRFYGRARLSRALVLLCFAAALCPLGTKAAAPAAAAAAGWSARFDGDVRFYQLTELGVVLVGTEKSLYAVDGERGEILWRRKDVRLDETDIAPIPATDILLVSLERDGKTRLEATDIFTGARLWQSDRVRGSVMQMAVDTEAQRVAVVLVREARGKSGDSLKKHPVTHVFDLSSGNELWKHETGEVELMPARWGEREGEEVETAFTLDNYHPPLFADGRLYLFYEGVTSFDAATGKSREREKFRVNEEGLALTEADPVFDERFIYTSGRGRLRAVSRANLEVAWEAKDVGLAPEMILAGEGSTLFVRTGGQFTRLKDGETVERGPYGVSAIDAATGKVRWRYKGADKGITNLALPDRSTVLVADRDDLIWIDAATGKRRSKISHRVERAAFVLLNEAGAAVVGGRNEVAAFDASDGRELWRTRHTPPGRGFLRTVAAITARAASLYVRDGGAAASVFGGVRTVSRAASALRWSGLSSARNTLPGLTSLAAGAARQQITSRFASYGLASRVRQAANYRLPNIPNIPTRPTLSDIPRPSMPAARDVEERLLDRLDPASQLARLSRFLWRRERLAALRGQWMYFYTDLKTTGGNGLAGVNVNNGRTERELRLGNPDPRFNTDEETGLLYTAQGNRLNAYTLGGASRY
ncbi:MAG TPA: PQQ-binding-like beta-propeller repeat protein [Pyrinomonadaceae bacterium]|nr:PQQ-binding-like beta-propeller repeat protein [Pyrinomonadaceae bacterium]